jgi:hypothetical protein
MRLIFTALLSFSIIASTAFAQPASRGIFEQGIPRDSWRQPPAWIKIEALNGQIYYADAVSKIESNFEGTSGKKMVRILVYTDDGNPPNFWNAAWYYFDCDKPYGFGDPLPRPPGMPPAIASPPIPTFIAPKTVMGGIRLTACFGWTN